MGWDVIIQKVMMRFFFHVNFEHNFSRNRAKFYINQTEVTEIFNFSWFFEEKNYFLLFSTFFKK